MTRLRTSLHRAHSLRGLGWVVLLVQSVALAEDRVTTEYDCLIEPDEVVALSMAVEGVLASVEVDRGDPVKVGQLLARLDSRVEKAAVAGVRAKAEQDSEIRLHQAELALAQRKAKRIEDLFKASNASAQERDEARAQVDIARAKLGQAQEAKRLAVLELTRVEAALARRTLFSPLDGVVTERHRNAGEYVEKEPVLTIARIDPLRAEVLLPAHEFGRLSTGQRVELQIGDASSWHQAGVDRIDPVLDSASGSFSVRLTLPNPDGRIPSGLECRMRYRGAETTEYK